MGIAQLPFVKYSKNSIRPKEYELPEDLYVEQFRIPKGTVVKLMTGRDFGFVQTPDLGNSRRLFKY